MHMAFGIVQPYAKPLEPYKEDKKLSIFEEAAISVRCKVGRTRVAHKYCSGALICGLDTGMLIERLGIMIFISM